MEFSGRPIAHLLLGTLFIVGAIGGLRRTPVALGAIGTTWTRSSLTWSFDAETPALAAIVGWRFSAIASSMISLVACERPLNVFLASENERVPHPRFIVVDPKQPDRAAKINEVTLYACFKRDAVIMEDCKVEWQARPGPPGIVDPPRLATFAYDEDAAFFKVYVPAVALRPGVYYLLGVRGPPGTGGEVQFVVDASGKVVQKKWAPLCDHP